MDDPFILEDAVAEALHSGHSPFDVDFDTVVNAIYRRRLAEAERQ